MAITTFADYQVLSGTSTTLDAATAQREVEFDFSVAGPDRVISNDVRRPVVAFHLRVHKQASLKVFANGQSMLSWALDVDTKLKGVWQPWSAATELPQSGKPVKLRFLVSPSGKVDIANVLIWYQVQMDG